MPDENSNTTTPTTPIDDTTQVAASNVPSDSSPVVVDPVVSETPSGQSPEDLNSNDIISNVINKINNSQNILIALSSDPSVDELSAAIGLSLFLDKLGKRATAIYSGTTPNALEFLKPEETFEPTVDTLQDFVIALNKEKADHLRYKLDGDYVKIFITPYHARISEEDLEYSYGDFNVDLVLALDVANGVDLDSALREHGRIMHDASIVNITTGNPGKLGEIEWSDKTASSVSEMIAKLLYSVNGKAKIEKEEATAFLTGIVAATDRFSSANTTPETMKISSRLMESGANQQLVSKNITPDLENEMFTLTDTSEALKKKDNDPTKLEVEHSEEKIKEPEKPSEPVSKETPPAKTVPEPKEVSTTITEKESTLLDDLKAAEASLSQAGAETTPEETEAPLKIDTLDESTGTSTKPDISSSVSDALAQIESNPAALNTPSAPTTPEINGVPEINYGMPMPGEEVLPPPPTPPVDFRAPMPNAEATDFSVAPSTQPFSSSQPAEPSQPIIQTTPIEPATPPLEPTPEPLGSQPSMQDQVYNPQASDPGAFKIPGM